MDRVRAALRRETPLRSCSARRRQDQADTRDEHHKRALHSVHCTLPLWFKIHPQLEARTSAKLLWQFHCGRGLSRDHTERMSISSSENNLY